MELFFFYFLLPLFFGSTRLWFSFVNVDGRWRHCCILSPSFELLQGRNRLVRPRAKGPYGGQLGFLCASSPWHVPVSPRSSVFTRQKNAYKHTSMMPLREICR